jgi:hypothetical protein
MVGELLGEYLQGAGDKAHGSVRVTAGTASLRKGAPASDALSNPGGRGA